MSILDQLSELTEQALDYRSATPTTQRQLIEQSAGDSRLQNVDLIWTQTGVGCCLAMVSGWKYGYASNKRPCNFSTGTKTLHDPIFVDNEFKRYNHERHLEQIRRWEKFDKNGKLTQRVKYATVRDVMTEEQCEAASKLIGTKVEYYTPEQIREWADEIAEYVDNVLIVPKYEGAMDLFPPDKFMVGYSVPTSYGGNPVPLEHYEDYKIHLLGGSPAQQILHWSAMPDNVVSLDNNYMHKMACKGQMWLLDGTICSLNDLNLRKYERKSVPPETIGFGTSGNILYIVLAISLGSFATYFRQNSVEQYHNAMKVIREESGDDPENLPNWHAPLP